MDLKFIAALWVGLASLCAGFLRTAPDVSPFTVPYMNDIGLPDLAQIIAYNGTVAGAPDGAGIKSYWFISFLTLENGHDYFLLHSTSNAGQELLTSISLMDITAKTYSGRNWFTHGYLSVEKADSLSPDRLHIYATTEDNFSEWKAVSVDPTYPFNLTHTPKGTNSYQGGTGSYIWGGGRVQAWDAPEALTTGTLTINNTEIAVVPSKSLTWMDWQYGPGYASEGWYSFLAVLTNGIKITTMTTFPTEKYAGVSLATLGFPDGHHETYSVEKDFHPRDPWVSPETGITYYRSYQVNIPAKGISLNVSVAMEGGELYNPDDRSKGIIVADTFSWYEGTYEGLPITGFGNAERMAGSSPDA